MGSLVTANSGSGNLKNFVEFGQGDVKITAADQSKSLKWLWDKAQEEWAWDKAGTAPA